MNELNYASLEASQRLVDAGIVLETEVMIIPLSQGKDAFIDAEDYERLSRYTWHAVKRKNQNVWYAERSIWNGRKGHTIPMHRDVLNLSLNDGNLVDHKDRNGLHNWKDNLRIASNSVNSYNRKQNKNNTSGFRGVSWHSRDNQWIARIRVNSYLYNLGYYQTAELAAKAYNLAATKYFGNDAVLNNPY